MMRIVIGKKSRKNIIFLLLFIGAAFGIIAFSHTCTKLVAQTVATNRNTTIIVDAGHGGVDGGTSADDGTLEKTLNLEIALRLSDILKCMGYNVIMTRTDDVSIHDSTAKTIREKKVSDIRNRLAIINNTPDCVFVSIHQNHYSFEKSRGTQVFFSPNNSESMLLAEAIQSSVKNSLQPENTRTIKKSSTDIYLLYHATAPAVLVECGFLSNKAETELLKDVGYQNKLSFLIAMGIIDYINSEAVL